MDDRTVIIEAFEEFIKEHKAENCYVGITDDHKRRFNEHKVTEEGLWEDVRTEKNAGDIEQIFLDKYKPENIKGKGGGGKGKSKYVYIYEIIPGVTDEEA